MVREGGKGKGTGHPLENQKGGYCAANVLALARENQVGLLTSRPVG